MTIRPVSSTYPRFATCSALAAFCSMSFAQPSPAAKAPPATPAPAVPLLSDVYDWEKLVVTPNAKGVRRMVFDGSTATVDKIHCHITTLNPGEKSGEPTKHLQE